MIRKILLLSMVLMLAGVLATAQNNTVDIIQVSQNNDILQVSFTLPTYDIIDTSLFVPYGIREVFNYIEIDDEFGIIDSVGLPQLPQLSFDLFVPYDATDFEIDIISAETMKIGIDKKIMPAQEDVETENPVFNFSMNRRYYASMGGFCSFFIQFNESFIVFGEQGINVTIFPFIYNPQEDSLTVLNNAVFSISYNLTETRKEIYHSIAKDNYLNSLFKNYNIEESNKVSNKGRYLMITPLEYESTLTYFANYKRNIGFDVTVVTTNTIGTSVTSIKNYIQNRYNNTSTRPDYVLLVGDVDKIPAYEGDPAGDEEDPITDLGYSLLEGNDNLADVFLGRFSVSNENGVNELKNIINKTIFMEMNMHRFIKKAKFLAGNDDHWNHVYMESEFRRGHEYVIPYSFEPLGYDCEKIYQPSSYSAFVDALNDNPLFYIYHGHGSVISINQNTYNNCFQDAANFVFPFIFAFACRSGNFANMDYICLGERFIRAENKGAVAYFGASVITLTNSNVAIEKRIFGDSFLTDNHILRAIINTGMRRYTYVAGIGNKAKERHLKAYNLLGDPSFDTKGIGCQQNFTFNNPEVFKQDAKVTYRANNNIQNENTFVVESGAEVKLLAGNSVVLKPGFRAEAGSNVEIKIVPCDDGSIQKSSLENNNDEKQHITEEITQFEFDEVINSVMETDEIIYPALFSIFPNPANDDFSLAYTLEENSFVQIDLYNMQGVLIKNYLQLPQQEAGIYYHNFSLSNLPSGLYMLVIKNNAKTFSSKIIKH